jgi:hypothetical protein
MLRQYGDLLANVRRDGIYHSIRGLVTPNQPLVHELADVLIQSKDFVGSAQDFVNSFTQYKDEVGDYWAYPVETLAYFEAWRELQGKGVKAESPTCDCDDMAILLGSILRNYIPPDEIFCAIGLKSEGGKEEGHMWDLLVRDDTPPRIIEATSSSSRPPRGKYKLAAMFNDKYAFATPRGIQEFGLIPVPLVPELGEVLATAIGRK